VFFKALGIPFPGTRRNEVRIFSHEVRSFFPKRRSRSPASFLENIGSLFSKADIRDPPPKQVIRADFSFFPASPLVGLFFSFSLLDTKPRGPPPLSSRDPACLSFPFFSPIQIDRSFLFRSRPDVTDDESFFPPAPLRHGNAQPCFPLFFFLFFLQGRSRA